MVCPSCAHDSESSEQFCVNCEYHLTLSCATCETSLPDGAQYCGSCGSRVGRSAGDTQTYDGPTTDTPAAAPTAVPASPHPASFQDGRYKVKNFLGEGSTKKVYLVEDTLLDRDVAFALIKAAGLNEVGRQRILREAQTMGRLGDHSNIVQIYDFGDEDSQPFMVFPVMPGGDIEGLIKRAPKRRLPIKQVVSTAKDVCQGLRLAHSRGIIHRDLKPGNVWLTADGTAKIGDFGLAITLNRSRLTQKNVIVGTLWYMAPGN